MHLISLPTDILLLILHGLGIHELATLSSTCRILHSLVDEYGWAIYARLHPTPSYSLARSRREWSDRERVQYDDLTNSNWKSSQFTARPLARPWRGKLQPSLAISPSHLVVAAGSTLHFYEFGTDSVIIVVGTYTFKPAKDVISTTFVDDGDAYRTLMVGFSDGSIAQVTIESLSPVTCQTSPVPLFDFGGESEAIESLSSQDSLLLSLAAGGMATLSNVHSLPSASPTSSIYLERRSWVAHLNLSASTPYAAFGTTSPSPLTLYSVTNDGLSDSPSATLASGVASEGSNAVYAISQAPLAYGASPHVLMSGWFDGYCRVHDLRSSSLASSDSLSSVVPLRPVMKFCDRWQLEPIYSLSCGGGSSNHVAAGLARHSVVAFWDIRAPKQGWSVHAPGNDSSPVYSIHLESSRLFGATQSRPFIYDFGPNPRREWYPHLPYKAGLDGLERQYTDSPGFYTTIYNHRSTTTV